MHYSVGLYMLLLLLNLFIFLRTMSDQRQIQVLAASVTAVVVFLFVRWVKRNGDKDCGKRYPPTLPILPVFGAVFRGGMTVLPDHFMKSAKDYGPVFSFTVGKR